MYLHEEYMHRHKINVPLILYKSRSTVFLKSQSVPCKWRILAFSWRAPDRHPGFWEMSYNEAVHDGWELSSLVKTIDKIDVCYWDEYEKFVWHMRDQIIKDGYRAIEAEEQVLASWQIFLMMYDSWLARNMGEAFFKAVGASLDDRLPRQSRLAAFEEAQRKLCVSKSVNDVWSFQLFPLAKSGSEWLVRLINGQ